MYDKYVDDIVKEKDELPTCIIQLNVADVYVNSGTKMCILAIYWIYNAINKNSVIYPHTP